MGRKVIFSIFEESDYSVFKCLEDNRDVTESRVNKLVASISEKYILNPIIVNEKMEIIDGQGRYEALKRLEMPIHYIIAEGATSDDCRRMNKYNTKWSAIDFAKSYAKSGNQNYVRLLKACELTGMSINRVLRLANKGGHIRSSRNQTTTLFETGRISFTEQDIFTVETIKEKANDILEALLCNVRPNDAFYTGVKIITEFDGYNHQQMIRNCIKARSTYAQMANISSQLKEFERIYNIGMKKNKLYFSDYMRNKGYNIRTYDFDSKYAEENISTLERTQMEG